MEEKKRYKRGDLSPDGKKRFWKRYGKDGADVWYPVETFDRIRTESVQRHELNAARRDFNKMQAERKAAASNNTNTKR